MFDFEIAGLFRKNPVISKFRVISKLGDYFEMKNYFEITELFWNTGVISKQGLISEWNEYFEKTHLFRNKNYFKITLKSSNSTRKSFQFDNKDIPTRNDRFTHCRWFLSAMEIFSSLTLGMELPESGVRLLPGLESVWPPHDPPANRIVRAPQKEWDTRSWRPRHYDVEGWWRTTHPRIG
jgi:hypothetical protein